MREAEMKQAKAEYERFKLVWMQQHGFTLNDLMEELERMREECDPDMTLKSLFHDWEFGFGFGSQIWPCFEEFLECEYKEMEVK